MDSEAFQPGHIALMWGHVDDDARGALKPAFPKVLRWPRTAPDSAAHIEALLFVPENVNFPALSVYVALRPLSEFLHLFVCSPSFGYPRFLFYH
jgi:hypothetical protein